MKSILLAKQVAPTLGKFRVTFVDVNAAEDLNQFRIGTRTGEFDIDIFGTECPIERGKSYVLDISEFVEGAEEIPAAAPVIAAPIAPATENTTTLPATDGEAEQIQFTGIVTIIREDNNLMISVKPLEGQTDTQANPGPGIGNITETGSIEKNVGVSSDANNKIGNTGNTSQVNTTTENTTLAENTNNTDSTTTAPESLV